MHLPASLPDQPGLLLPSGCTLDSGPFLAQVAAGASRELPWPSGLAQSGLTLGGCSTLRNGLHARSGEAARLLYERPGADGRTGSWSLAAAREECWVVAQRPPQQPLPCLQTHIPAQSAPGGRPLLGLHSSSATCCPLHKPGNKSSIMVLLAAACNPCSWPGPRRPHPAQHTWLAPLPEAPPGARGGESGASDGLKV